MHLRTTAARAAILVLCLSALPAAATLYKWTDANGKVVYSDIPPPDRVIDKTIKRAAPADPAANKTLSQREAEFQKGLKDQADAEQKAQKDADTTRRRNEACASARGSSKLIRDGTKVYRLDENGRKVFLDDSDRAKALEEREQFLKESCAD